MVLNRPEYDVASASCIGEYDVGARRKDGLSCLGVGNKCLRWQYWRAAVYVTSEVCEPKMVAKRGESDLILKARDEAGLWCVMHMCWHCEPDGRRPRMGDKYREGCS